MKIIYIHHGHRKIGNPPSKDDDLSKLGIKDAKMVSKLLKLIYIKDKNNLTAIYTSNFYRCIKTAKLINKYIKLPIIEEERLNEHKANLNETWLDTQKRILAVINEICDKYKNDEIVICVTSGVNIAPFICKQFNIELTENTPYIGVPCCSPIIFDYNKKNIL